MHHMSKKGIPIGRLFHHDHAIHDGMPVYAADDPLTVVNNLSDLSLV